MSPAHLKAKIEIIKAYARTQRQYTKNIARILRCMSEGYLRTLPKKRDSQKLPRIASLREWRHKFNRSIGDI